MSSGPTYRVILKPSASNAFRKLPKKARVAIGSKIDALATNPRPHGYVKLVDQDDLYRVRAGNYRRLMLGSGVVIYAPEGLR